MQIEIFTTEMGVAIGRLYLEHTVSYFEDGNVERAATQIEHRDLFVLFLVQTIGQ